MYECVKSSTLSLEQRTECCRKFISDMIRGYGCVLGPPSEDCPRKNQLHTRAEHDFLDFKRTLDRIQKHEIPISERDGDLDEGNSLEPVDPSPTPEECLMQKALSEAIVKALEKLNPRQQQLFHLKYGEDKTVIEIAAAMNLSENAASHAIQRMEERLRKILVQSGVREEPPGFHRAPPPPQALTSVSILVKSL